MRVTSGFKILSLVVVLVITVSGCYYDKEQLLYPPAAANSCDSLKVTFSGSVAPLIQSKCATAGCHDANTGAGATVLTTYSQIVAKSARIYQRAVVDKTMPLSGPLSATEIAILNCWITSGTPNN
ncbi:MAG: hypothetical protein KGM98_06265 [Bacteroidota bacterium]|nr:hypothetical protein [Bacteroidota bacterium]